MTWPPRDIYISRQHPACAGAKMVVCMVVRFFVVIVFTFQLNSQEVYRHRAYVQAVVTGVFRFPPPGY